MKRILILSTAVLALGATNANAQETASLQKATRLLNRIFMPQKKHLAARPEESSETKVMRPSKAYNYTMSGSQWALDNSQELEWNTSGYNTQTTTTESNAEKTRTQTKYDEVYGNIATETTASTYDVSAAEWSTPLVTMSRELLKDEKNRVTNDKINTLDEDGKTMETVQNNVYTYGDDDRMSSLITTVDMSDDDEGSLLVPITFTNLVWDAYDTSSFFSIDNDADDLGLLNNDSFRLKSGKVSISAYGVSMTGNINVTYTDTESELKMSMKAMGMTVMNTTVKKTKTDDYGSYTVNATVTADGETTTMSKTVKLNQYGDKTNCVEQTSDEPDSLYEQNYDYEYNVLDDGTALKKSVVVSTRNSSSESLKETEKTVYEDYIDCSKGTTAIKNVAESTSTDTINGFYGLNGSLTGKSLSSLPKGVYIEKKDGKTIKVVKR